MESVENGQHTSDLDVLVCRSPYVLSDKPVSILSKLSLIEINLKNSQLGALAVLFFDKEAQK